MSSINIGGMAMQKFLEIGHTSGADRIVLMFALFAVAAGLIVWMRVRR